MREDISEAFNKVIHYIRTKHAAEIDTAYDFFWEEEDPQDILSSTALELGFLNFEDWLICDYRPKDGTGFIDRYIEDEKPDEGTTKVLGSLKDSFISLYEVLSVEGGGVKLRDLVRNTERTLRDEGLSSLTPAKLFAARLLLVDDAPLMGRCVYPFGDRREPVRQALQSQYERYTKHVDSGANMEAFLRSETYVFNTIWVSSLYNE
jgi:hypothetical protein